MNVRNEKDKEYEVDLFDIIRKNIALLIALPLMLALITAIYSWTFLADIYTAEVSIYALMTTSTQSISTDTTDSYVTNTDLQASQLLANDFAELAENDQIQQDTADALGIKDLSEYNVDITSSTSTRVIKISVSGADGELAAAIANKLANEIGETAIRVMGVEAVNVVNAAKTPDEPSGPNRVLFTAAAFLVGIVLALGIGVINDVVDKTIKSDSEIEKLLNVPVIGRFPYEKGMNH